MTDIFLFLFIVVVGKVCMQLNDEVAELRRRVRQLEANDEQRQGEV